jgi:predicted nucleic acid-binding protein
MTEQFPAAIVYLDAMVFIFSIEGKPDVSEPVKALFEVLQNRPGVAVTSELTLAEVLAGSEHSLSPPIKRAYLDLIVWSKFLDLAPVGRQILYDSAELRFIHQQTHKKKLKLPDAIHLATARQRRCRYFVSADKGIRPPMDMRRVAPDIYGVAEIKEALA